jgi:hypothetical protein
VNLRDYAYEARDDGDGQGSRSLSLVFWTLLDFFDTSFANSIEEPPSGRTISKESAQAEFEECYAKYRRTVEHTVLLESSADSDGVFQQKQKCSAWRF